jgi:hypothetical protein
MLAQARGMTAGQLGDRLLPAGHAPIVEAMVHPRGMEAPTTWVTSVDLTTRAYSGDPPGFCAAKLYKVNFVPAATPAPGARTPARPASIETTTLYKFTGAQPARGQTCQDERSPFFPVSETDGVRRVTLVRLLAQAQAAATRGDIDFDLSFEDRMADDFDRQPHDGDHMAGGLPYPFPGRLRDGRAALAAFPLDQIVKVSPDPWPDGANAASKSALKTLGAQASLAQFTTADGDWLVDLVMFKGRIHTLHVVRRIPPPF